MSQDLNPRLLTADALAKYLSLPKSDFDQKIMELSKQGFPRPLEHLGMWDICAVNRWLDTRFDGLANTKPERSAAWIHPFNWCPPARPPKRPNPGLGRKPYRVQDAMSDYVKDFRGCDCSLRNTIYMTNAYLLPTVGHIRVRDLKASDIRGLLHAVANTPRRVRSGFGKEPRFAIGPFDEDAKRRRKCTCNRILSILKAGLNHAYREGKVPSDDEWRRVRPYPRTENTKPVFLNQEQCRNLVASCAPDFRKLVQAALLTGARMVELINIMPGDFDARNGTVFLAKAKYQKARHVILTQEGVRFFSRISSKAAKDSVLLKRKDGYQWDRTDPYPRLESACQLAGIFPRVTFHQLRHTYASLLAMEGVPMAVIAKNLGHANTLACERYYAHLSPSYVRETIRASLPNLGIGKL